MSVARSLGLLAYLAEVQDGLVTTRQAEHRGVPRRDLVRMVNAGAMERIAHGVYRVAGVPRSRLVELRAAWLQLAPGTDVDQRTVEQGVVSHTSAAVVYQVGLLEPFRHEFTIPSPRRLRSRREDIAIHHAPLRPDEAEWAEELLVTSPVRLVADLCAVTLDGDHLAGVVTDLVNKDLLRREDLLLVLAAHSHRYGFPTAESDKFVNYVLAGVQEGRR